MALTEFQKAFLKNILVPKTSVIDPDTGEPVDWDSLTEGTAPSLPPELLKDIGGTIIDTSAAETGTGVVASIADEATIIDFSDSSWQYWDVPDAIGTGDFDRVMRLIDKMNQVGGGSIVLARFGLTDAARTRTTGLFFDITGGGVAAAMGAFPMVGDALQGFTASIGRGPVLLRISRVGTTVTWRISLSGGIKWETLATVSSSLDIGKIGLTLHTNGGAQDGSVVVDWIKSL